MADSFAPPTSPPPPKDLPAGWKATWHPKYEQWYYSNIYTKQSVWEKPTEPALPEGDVPPSGAPPGYHPSTSKTVGPEKGGANLSEDEKLARKLQDEENARAGSSGNRGESDSYYQGPSSGGGLAPPAYDQGPFSSPGGSPQPQKKGLFSKLLGKKHDQQQPQYQQYPQGPYQQGPYPQQGYPSGYGPYQNQQQYVQPGRKPGLGVGTGAALGLGGGLLGGVLLGEALDGGDHGGYGGDDGGYGGDDGGGDFGGGDFGGGDF